MMKALPIRRLIPWKRRRSKLFRMTKSQKVLAFFLTLLGLLMIMPIIYIFNTAFKPLQELFVYPPRFWVRDPSIQNFNELFLVTKNSTIPVTRYLFNSVISTFLAVVAVCVVSTMAAYPLSKHKFPGSKLLFAIIILSLMFVPETVAIPRYLVISNLGIMNTYFGHIFPLIASSTSVFLIKQFIDQMPNELIEAARIDGAKEFKIFMSIVIPMCMPSIATTAILTFQHAWGNVETSNLYMQNEEMKTFPFFLHTMLITASGNTVARAGAVAASSLILFLPNLIIFLFFQGKVIATMAHSGIK